MEKEIFYVLYGLGIIGFLFPFYENSAIGCGFETSIITYESRYLYQDFYENIKLFKPEMMTFIGFILLSIVFVSILFTPIFYFYKKYLSILLLSLITVGYFVYAFINASEMLVCGYYILLFQQLFMVGFVVKYYFNQNKNNS